jgi:hypothetical protein
VESDLHAWWLELALRKHADEQIPRRKAVVVDPRTDERAGETRDNEQPRE